MKYVDTSCLDVTKEYGMVLEGGGAKGAYQIGVWKALKEAGIKIKGVAGVSVGALNGALISMGDIEVAETIWSNITYSQIMNVDDADMEKILKHDLKNLSLTKVTRNGAKVVAARGIDITPLRCLVKKYVDEKKIRESDIELVLGTISVSDRKALEIEAKALNDGELKDYLIASASLPVFKQEKLQGKTFLDGGMVNNVPIDMLIKRGYKDIIVVRIFGIGIEKRIKIPEDVRVIEIAPRVDLGHILEFNKKKVSRNIIIGYYDALRTIHGLIGTIYYIRDGLEEQEVCMKFMQLNPMVKMAFLEYYKEDYSCEEVYTRKFFEVVLPNIAAVFGLDKNWTYKELYIAMLELAAKNRKVKKYKVYTEEEFIQEIVKNNQRAGDVFDAKDALVSLIIKLIVIGSSDR